MQCVLACISSSYHLENYLLVLTGNRWFLASYHGLMHTNNLWLLVCRLDSSPFVFACHCLCFCYLSILYFVPESEWWWNSRFKFNVEALVCLLGRKSNRGKRPSVLQLHLHIERIMWRHSILKKRLFKNVIVIRSFQTHVYLKINKARVLGNGPLFIGLYTWLVLSFCLGRQ